MNDAQAVFVISHDIDDRAICDRHVSAMVGTEIHCPMDDNFMERGKVPVREIQAIPNGGERMNLRASDITGCFPTPQSSIATVQTGQFVAELLALIYGLKSVECSETRIGDPDGDM